MVWLPEKTFELQAVPLILHLISLHLDRLQGARDKTWTRKTQIADSMTATCIQECGINSNCRFYLNERSELTQFCNYPLQSAAHINREVRMVLWQQNKSELPQFLFITVNFRAIPALSISCFPVVCMMRGHEIR